METPVRVGSESEEISRVALSGGIVMPMLGKWSASFYLLAQNWVHGAFGPYKKCDEKKPKCDVEKLPVRFVHRITFIMQFTVRVLLLATLF